MAKRKRQIDQKKIEKWRDQERGRGAGSDYKPWLIIRDVASEGFRHRIKGIKTGGRLHHYLSDIEAQFHYAAEAAPNVIDIREQWPLDLEMTLAIAKELNLEHPADPQTGEPIVMTTDFLLTVLVGFSNEHAARTVKTIDKLTRRTLEKFEIERIYFQILGISWGIVTERDIPKTITKNMEFLFKNRTLEDHRHLSESDIQRVAKVLTPMVVAGGGTLSELTTLCDRRLGMVEGDSLAIAYHLLCNQIWQIDLRQPLEPNRKLILLNQPLG